jgi:hypothetical protein
MALTNEHAELIQHYFRVWTAVWKSLCGWDHERVERWAERYATAMENPTLSFFHEHPLSYVAQFLVPQTVSSKWSGIDLLPILTQLETSLRDGDPRREVEPSFCDGSSAALRIDAVLAQYGSSIQAVCRELDAQKIGIDP